MLSDWYLWIKAFHIMSVIAWMAGLFYLPRLFVYHVERGRGIEPSASFEIMEARLLRAIMNPAMIATWIFGLMLAHVPGVIQFDTIWVWTKLAAVLTMSAFHMWLARQRRLLKEGRCTVTGRQFRLMNEVPTALMVVIVLSVVLKP